MSGPHTEGPAPAPTVALNELTEQIARRFHEVYEQLGPGFGWQTQESARGKSFDELPESNRQLILATVGVLLDTGVIEPGPGVLTRFRAAGASDA